jgi:hypothetical protein
MDLTQRKLTRAEWNNIEIPVSSSEKQIINMICQGYHNINIGYNYTKSLLTYLKIVSTPPIEYYVFEKYIAPELVPILKEFNLGELSIKKKRAKHSIKKADIIRFSNTDQYLSTQKSELYEFIIIDLFNKMFQARHHHSLRFTSKKEKEQVNRKGNEKESIRENKKKKEKSKLRNNTADLQSWQYYYYTIHAIMSYNINNTNALFTDYISMEMKKLEGEIVMSELVKIGDTLIEKNDMLLKYADETLYPHQKTLFTICKSPEPKLISYIAPTGTGKTMSPLGLSENHKIIFVCAARHVGLALAKAAISVEKKVAFAFGCGDANDIRLHYYAATDYVRNRKSGSIAKVDNSVGDKVEIMICDIKSYLPAMLYMMAFNKPENIILYWDEPTITMDYETHDCHKMIHKNWNENLIPNIVLSSATLPCQEEIQETIMDFKSRHENAEYYSVVSYDCKKTIPLINKEGFVEMPHYMCKTYDEVTAMVKHCDTYKTLLRYIDLKEAINFIVYVNSKSAFREERYSIDSYFQTLDKITMSDIKLYYLLLLGNLNDDMWESIHCHMVSVREKRHESNIYVATKDATTLTDGPTIFLADEVEKVATFCLKSAKIPNMVIGDIRKAIQYNDTVGHKIDIMQKTLDDGTKKDQEKEKKMSEGRIDPAMKQLQTKIQEMQSSIKTVSLYPMFVPNTREHIERFHTNTSRHIKTSPFTSDITEAIVEKIMKITDIEDTWKMLLLMGIGVFASHNSIAYMEIMKELAQAQKLYLIIASTDFIYGTNYQFCHGYISKDLGYMSQEKCIQAMGRVGRNKLQQDYTFRFRENDLIRKLFTHDDDKPEVKNMAILFNC